MDFSPTVVEGVNGIKTITEYETNAEGQTVKIITQLISKHLKPDALEKIAARRKWVKYGDCKGLPPGPDSQSTTLGENILLNLTHNSNSLEDAEDNVRKAALANSKIVCRLCQGEHLTAKCPFKDTYSQNPELKKEASTESIFFLT
jgi:translation initiation factor 3 subunit G